jgi:hypothetical protein
MRARHSSEWRARGIKKPHGTPRGHSKNTAEPQHTAHPPHAQRACVVCTRLFFPSRFFVALLAARDVEFPICFRCCFRLRNWKSARTRLRRLARARQLLVYFAGRQS